ncbi:helix-turn-helix domain-containing protein [Tahibacter amnicola]|uniref:Helix-turn-helix domain-containing protein n=1 Tax=Tahibacter amnicola TaxID=2976241 RepID=A0ABY6BM94_9GAMM|nr:helix-turn-helix domain-containing protein [Tahibacter amnicola]UXI68937.1 helix-turn-helix domain-containing protein [Tahibacter amnicola]
MHAIIRGTPAQMFGAQSAAPPERASSRSRHRSSIPASPRPPTTQRESAFSTQHPMLTQHFLFFFAMLGAFNGIGLASFLWWRANGEATQRWLALLVLAVGLRTGKSVVFYFWPGIPRIVLQVGLTACFLIGPCLFFLVRSSQGDAARPGRADGWHIAGLLVIATVVNLLWPYGDHVDLWKQVIVPGILYSWLGYLLLATAQVYIHRARIRGTPARVLLLGAVAGVWVIWLAYFTSGYTSYIVGALSFTFVLAASVVVYLRLRSGLAPIEPYQDRRIPEPEAATQLQALAELMARERLHLDHGLTLPRLARRLGMPQARLSQLLNDNNQTSFKQYLAQLRVVEAKTLLRQLPPKPLEVVAAEAGFQSMSTFHSTFKKLEGATPAAFRAAQVDS